MAAVTPPSPPIPPMLLVRLKAGVGVRESRRVCHLVPVPDAEAGYLPAVLWAYCGETIPPGAAEVLDGLAGAPCEPCLAKLPIPAFALLRLLPPSATGDPADQGAGWWDFGLRQDQKITARFVLLLLLQDPTRHLSIAEIADRLEQDDPATINLIMLVHASVGWVERVPDQDDLPWEACSYRLTERGAPLARHLLRKGLTATFAAMAGGLGVGITVLFEHPARSLESNPDTESSPDTTDPGGRSGGPGDAAPAGHHPSAHDPMRNPVDDEETS